jgi:hypothetical protein
VYTNPPTPAETLQTSEMACLATKETDQAGMKDGCKIHVVDIYMI